MNQPPPGGSPPAGSPPPHPSQQAPTSPHGGFPGPQAQAAAPGALAEGAPGALPGGAPAGQAAGFMRSLVDFSFENFISPRVLKIGFGFWLFMLVPSVFGLFFVWYEALSHEGYNFAAGTHEWDPLIGTFCGATVAYPLMIFMWVLTGRVLFERGILAFRQYDLNKQILEELKRR